MISHASTNQIAAYEARHARRLFLQLGANKDGGAAKRPYNCGTSGTVREHTRAPQGTNIESMKVEIRSFLHLAEEYIVCHGFKETRSAVSAVDAVSLRVGPA